jgi:hypothetical protein
VKPKEIFIWSALAITVGVHLLSFVPFIHLSLELVWPLVFVPMAAFAITFGNRLRASLREVRPRFDRLPRGLRIGSWVTFGYSALTALVGLNTTGTPKVKASAFLLTEHGRVLRSLTENEYWKLARAEMAFFFGFLIVFAFAAIVNNALASQMGD